MSRASPDSPGHARQVGYALSALPTGNECALASRHQCAGQAQPRARSEKLGNDAANPSRGRRSDRKRGRPRVARALRLAHREADLTLAVRSTATHRGDGLSSTFADGSQCDLCHALALTHSPQKTSMRVRPRDSAWSRPCLSKGRSDLSHQTSSLYAQHSQPCRRGIGGGRGNAWRPDLGVGHRR